MKRSRLILLKVKKSVFQWPKTEDKLWIGFSDIICEIPEPLPTGKTKRMFKLNECAMNRILAAFMESPCLNRIFGEKGDALVMRCLRMSYF